MKSWSFLKFAGALLATVGIAIACTDAQHESPEQMGNPSIKQIDAKKIMDDPDLSKEAKSKLLAEAGEQLFIPETFFLAHEVFVEASKLDPKNMKAALYQAMLKPLMNMKGILGRIEPLVKKDTREYPAYKKQLENKDFFIVRSPYDKQIKKGSFLPSEFLADSKGLPLISTESELQDFVRGQVDAYDELRKFLNKNINLELEINISERWFAHREKKYSHYCRYKVITDFFYELECEDDPKFMKTKIDRGEMEVFKAMASGLTIQHILSSAYSVEEGQEVILKLRGQSLLTKEEKVETVIETSDQIGTLNDEHSLSKIISLGKDGMIGMRWIRDNHQELCPGQKEGMAFVEKGTHWDAGQQKVVATKKFIRREGKLIDQGLCMGKIAPYQSHSALGKIFDTIDLALKGQVITIRSGLKKHTLNSEINTVEDYREASGYKVKARIKPSLALLNPVKDLRELKPLKYNDCDEVYSFADNTLGGVFVDGDADSFLRATGEIDHKNGHCMGMGQ